MERITANTLYKKKIYTFSEYCKIKPYLDCNHRFLIDLVPNGIPFGTKYNEKSVTEIQIWFDLTLFRKYLSVCTIKS